MKRFLTGLLIGLSMVVNSHAAYPEKPIRFVVAFAPGSSIDTLARILSSRMAELLGQNIVVENQAGAGGTLGMDIGKAAAHDGYTLIVASASSMASAPLLQKVLLRAGPLCANPQTSVTRIFRLTLRVSFHWYVLD